MSWKTYGAVVGWIVGVGVAVGALLTLVVFAWLIPPDRGEEGVLAFMPVLGGFFGAMTAVAASVLYALCLALWTHRPGRSIASRAWVGALSAGGGALVFWIVFGLALSGSSGLLLGAWFGGASAVVAMLVAGPLTSRAARRADRRADSAVITPAESDDR